jgi:hypothetical protein
VHQNVVVCGTRMPVMCVFVYVCARRCVRANTVCTDTHTHTRKMRMLPVRRATARMSVPGRGQRGTCLEKQSEWVFIYIR